MWIPPLCCTEAVSYTTLLSLLGAGGAPKDLQLREIHIGLDFAEFTFDTMFSNHRFLGVHLRHDVFQSSFSRSLFPTRCFIAITFVIDEVVETLFSFISPLDLTQATRELFHIWAFFGRTVELHILFTKVHDIHLLQFQPSPQLLLLVVITAAVTNVTAVPPTTRCATV